MAIVTALKEYLSNHYIPYDCVHHEHSDSSFNSAAMAHIPSPQLAKAVIIESELGTPLMATIPANKCVSFEAIDEVTTLHYHMMKESEANRLFEDCESGALPSIGDVFGVEMIVDNRLLIDQPVYIEAGDHKTLLKIPPEAYAELVKSSRHANISMGHIGNKFKTDKFYSA
ncbi:MAG: YbaK/EbsC family protein [Pseudomonadales bacterium]|nr:YbaK/EbsC family protein [Pseudomonadales bacterium]